MKSLPHPYGIPLSTFGAPPYKSADNLRVWVQYVWEYRPGHHEQNWWGHVLQHRLVAEHCLGRDLLPGEVVHHEDENKQNNSPENLWLFPTQSAHMLYHKSKCPRHDPELLAALRPLAADHRIGQTEAARALGVSKSTLHKILVANGIQWANSNSHPLNPEEVQKALQGHSTLEAAKILGVSHGTLRLRFGELLQKRASPNFLDAHREEIRNLASTVRTTDLCARFSCSKPTMISAIRRWTAEEPDAWSDVSAFRLSRPEKKSSRTRTASPQSPTLPLRRGRPPKSRPSHQP